MQQQCLPIFSFKSDQSSGQSYNCSMIINNDPFYHYTDWKTFPRYHASHRNFQLKSVQKIGS